MATPVIVTQIPFNDPQPDTATVDYADEELCCMDPSQGRIYHLLIGAGIDDAGKVYVATLDMDSCQEIRRVEAVFPDTEYYPYWPIAVPGTDFILTPIAHDAVPRNYTATINTVTGAVEVLPNDPLGTGDAVPTYGNEYSYVFTLPLGADKTMVFGSINYDFYSGFAGGPEGSLLSSQLTHTSLVACLVDNTTGVFTFEAIGDKGVPKTKLYKPPDFVYTMGETFTYMMFPSRTVDLTKAVLYVAFGKWTDGTVALPSVDVVTKRFLYRITCTDALAWSYDEICEFTDDDTILVYGGGVHVPEDESVVLNYIVVADGAVLPGVDYNSQRTIKIDLATGNKVASVLTASAVLPTDRKYPFEITYPKIFNEIWRMLSVQPPYPEIWAPNDFVAHGTLSDVHVLNVETLATRVFYEGQILDTRYNQPPFNDTSDDATAEYGNIIFDYNREAIYAFSSTWDGHWERWTFGTAAEDPLGCFEVHVATFTEPSVHGIQDITFVPE